MILDDIIEVKLAEVAAAKVSVPEAALQRRAGFDLPRRGFARAIGAADRLAIIAEIKRASPSKGLLREDFRPADHARDYESAGAVCLSVLTDREFFQGDLADLDAARNACSIPVLRKDFIVDPYQIIETRAWGADAVLLIVASLEGGRLAELRVLAEEQGLDALVEVHDDAELDRALESGAGLIGINNRNLSTFETTLEPTRRLAARVPAGVTLVSESGFDRREQLRELKDLGVKGFLIGEHFMRAADPGRALAGILER